MYNYIFSQLSERVLFGDYIRKKGFGNFWGERKEEFLKIFSLFNFSKQDFQTSPYYVWTGNIDDIAVVFGSL